MAKPTAADVNSREIRVFISSTFRDFMEERDLLVKQVFPSLRRKAMLRGVEIVDVDLRWGITREESEQGKVIGICLGEIERCRPYFIGMLGERYGWTPQPGDYPQELLESEHLQWIRDHQGGASVTELEILHGVLNNQEMASRAFFYFRDPAWSRAQSDPGFVSDSPEEEQRLADLKQRIRSSCFQVAEDLADPAAIAAAIEADLLALIYEQFPDVEQTYALEKEARKHADYRRARLGAGQYIGGEAYIEQLERWLEEGQHQILITGESGAGKSALIANWMERHAQDHPGDVVYAHHLGCTNDANALRPLLARLIDTASAQLLEAEVISVAYAVPEDWWELVAKVAETLQTLGRWCERQGQRWIWVLDGLDRLGAEDQQALPWLPLHLPAGVQVVASALACLAREILCQRSYTLLPIKLLGQSEQEELIRSYLGRYTKQLDGGLRQRILDHQRAGSPLFLRVLLEELRQCGRYDMLDAQLAFYLSSETVDDLYERVLERLENDGSSEAVRKVMTALWASRAGLTEPELLEITDLKQLQWAPIDLAMEKAFGRNGNRLVFDHDYLRTAVEDRYLPTEEQQRQAHSKLADWYQNRDGWDKRDSEDLPWQLKEAGRFDDLRDWVLTPWVLARLQWDRGSRETINYWHSVKAEAGGELDELIAAAVEEEIEKRKDNAADQIWFVDQIGNLLDEAGLYRKLLLRLRTLSLELEDTTEERDQEAMLSSLVWLADTHRIMGQYNEAEELFLRCLEASERLLGPEHPSTLSSVGNLAGLLQDKGEYEQAETFYKRCLEARERLLGPEHPSTLNSVGNLAGLLQDKGEYEQAEAFYKRCLEARERLLGPEHLSTLASVGDLGTLYWAKGNYEQAEAFYKRCLEARKRLHGYEHPFTLATIGNLGNLYWAKGDYEQAEVFYKRCLEARERLLGPEHPDTLTSVGNLAGLFQDKGEYQEAEAYYKRDLEARDRLLGADHPSTLTTVGNLGNLYRAKGDYKQAEALFTRCLEARERLLGPEHPDTLTTIGNLGLLYSDKGDYEQAEAFCNRCMEASERLLGPEHPYTLTTIGNLGNLYRAKGDYDQAEAFYKRDVEASERLLGPEHPSTLTTIGNLGLLYSDKGDYEQAEAFYNRCMEARERLLGPEHPDTLMTVGNLGNLYRAKGDYEQAEAFYKRDLEASERLLGPEHPDTLTTIGNLGLLYSDKSDYEQAEAFCNRCLEARERLLGPEHPSTLTTVGNLGNLYRAKGDYEQAEAFCNRCLEARERLLGPEHPDTLTTVDNLSNLYRAKGDYEQAEAFCNRCLEARERLLGPEHPSTLTTVGNLGNLYRAKGDYEQAEAFCNRCLEARERLLGPEHPDTLTTIGNLGLLYSDKGDYEQAEAFYKRDLEARQRLLGPDHPDTLSSAYNLAEVLSQQGRPAEAIPLRRRELAWCREQNVETDSGTLTSINGLAIDLRETGALDEAEALFRELLVARQQVHEPSDFGIGRALGGLAKTLVESGKLEEAVAFAQQALDHRLVHEGHDAWWTNRERLDLAHILHKLGRSAEAIQLLDALQASITSKAELDDEDSQLLADAAALRNQIDASP
ncbi:MAG: tetratricopeptide repeat protein [Cyanobium sp. M30B3]|nr:MAG: tetratricopeptide repeat protein [Cyanobium sp. M30B3]